MSQTRVSANAVQTSSEVALQQIGDGSAQVSVKMGVGRPHGTVCVRYLYELASYMAPVKVKQSRGGATEAAGFGQWLQSHGEILDQHEAGTGRSNRYQTGQTTGTKKVSEFALRHLRPGSSIALKYHPCARANTILTPPIIARFDSEAMTADSRRCRTRRSGLDFRPLAKTSDC